MANVVLGPSMSMMMYPLENVRSAQSLNLYFMYSQGNKHKTNSFP